MRARYGRERHLVPPGQLLAFDPSVTHAGSSVEFGLIGLFREQTGLPPMPSRLLTASGWPAGCSRPGHPIASVAANTGFADQSHLHRQFQRGLGVTPLTYQRSVLG